MAKHYVHHVPGRLRVRIPFLKNNPQKIDEVRSVLDIHGTHKTKVNPLTGSIVITYDSDNVSAQCILDVLKSNGYFHQDRSIALDTQMNRTSSRAARKISKAMFGWAVGRVLEANGLSLIAAFI